MEAPAIAKTLRPIKVDISIIDESPFLSATIPWSLKVGILHKVQKVDPASSRLVINFPGEELILYDSNEKEI
uniref:Uncharacterized protein n=1 Tax=Romanomermis culicivorax TaxID=13658 RepID=A0A915KVL0_ROMCU